MSPTRKSLSLNNRTTSVDHSSKKKCTPTIFSKSSNACRLVTSTPNKTKHNVLAFNPFHPSTRDTRNFHKTDDSLPVLDDDILTVLDESPPKDKSTAMDVYKLLGLIDKHPDVTVTDGYTSDSNWSTLPYHDVIGDISQSPSCSGLDSDCSWEAKPYCSYIAHEKTTCSDSIANDVPKLPKIEDIVLELADDTDDVIIIKDLPKETRKRGKTVVSSTTEAANNIADISNVASSSSSICPSKDIIRDRYVDNSSRTLNNDVRTENHPQKIKSDYESFIEHPNVDMAYKETLSDEKNIAMPEKKLKSEIINTDTNSIIDRFSRMDMICSVATSNSSLTSMSDTRALNTPSVPKVQYESSDYCPVVTKRSPKSVTVHDGNKGDFLKSPTTHDSTISNSSGMAVVHHQITEDIKDIKDIKQNIRSSQAWLCDEVAVSVKAARTTTRSLQGRRRCGPAVRGDRRPSGEPWVLPFSLLTVAAAAGKDAPAPNTTTTPPPPPRGSKAPAPAPASTDHTYYLRKRQGDVFYAEYDDCVLQPAKLPARKSRKKLK